MQYLAEFLEWAGLPSLSPEDMAAWSMAPLFVGQELAAVGAVKGTEIHFAAAPDWRKRLITRRRTAEFLTPHFNRLGFLSTRSELTDANAARFLERMGFERTWADGAVQHWMLTALPFRKD